MLFRSAVKRALEDCNIDTKTINMIMDMHKGAKAYITLDNYKGDKFDIATGVRQGDVLAPLLFSLVINPILIKIDALGLGYSMKFSNNTISILAYCDDLLFIAKSRKDMGAITKILTKFLQDNDMDINPNKTVYTSNSHIKNNSRCQ